MEKLRRLWIVVALIAVSGCAMVGGPDNGSDETGNGSDPSGPVPPSENRLNVTLYTFDDITPEGGITLRASNNETGDVQSMELRPLLNTISGVSKWEGWVDMSTLNGDEYFTLNFVNSDDKRALGLSKYAAPHYRRVNLGHSYAHYETTDADAGIYSYVETVRHWESGDNGREIAISGSVETGDGDPLTGYNMNATWWHQISPSYYTPVNLTATELLVDASSEDLTTAIQDVYTYPAEERLPFDDSLTLEVQKDFFHSEESYHDYVDLHELSEISARTVRLYANRYVDVSYVYSEDATFTANDTPFKITLYTVDSGDFADYDLYRYFESTFYAEDPNVDGNDVYLDPSQNSQLTLEYSPSSDSEFRLRCSAGGPFRNVVPLSGDVPQAVDLSTETNWSNSVEVFESESPVIGVKTTNGYALVKIDDIRRMTTAEMNQIKSDFANSASAQTVSPQRVPEVEHDPARGDHID